MKVRPKNPYLCPICHEPILRLDLKTCGASDCLRKWRSLLSSERADLQFQAAEIAAGIPLEYDTEPIPNFFKQEEN